MQLTLLETMTNSSCTLGAVAISRKRHCRKVAFQQIATAPDVHNEFIVFSIKPYGYKAPRNDINIHFLEPVNSSFNK